jgi:hypothetical protein
MIALSGQTNSRQLRRDLRARIGRLRRRIDQRLGLVHSSQARLSVWREQIVRSPLAALLAAVAAGLALVSGLRGRKANGQNGTPFPAEEALRFARWLIGRLWSRFHGTADAPSESRPTEAEGGAHGGT